MTTGTITDGNYKLAESSMKDNDIPEGEKYGNNASWGMVNWRWGGGGVTEVGGWKRNEGRNAGYKYEGAQ